MKPHYTDRHLKLGKTNKQACNGNITVRVDRKYISI